jgi:capsular exopolysaccharide synthesis family protein
VIDAAIRDPQIAELSAIRRQPDPSGWLAKQLRVDYPGDAEILRISMSGENPNDLPKLVNAVKDSYLNRIVNAERNRRLTRLRDLEHIYDQSEEAIRKKRDDLRMLAEQLGTGDPEALTHRQQYALEHYAALKREDTRLRLELMRAEVELALLRSTQSNVQVSDTALNQQLESEPLVQEYSRHVMELQRIVDEVKSLSADENQPNVRRHVRELESAKQSLEARLEELRPLVSQVLIQEAQAASEASVAQHKAQIDLLAEQQRRFAEEADEYGKLAKDIGKSSVDIEIMRAEINQVDRVTERIGSEMAALKVELQAPSRVTLVHQAEVPRTKDRTQQIGAAVAAGAMAFLCFALCIAYWEYRTGRIGTPAELELELGVKVVGALPNLERRGLMLNGHNGLQVANHDRVFAESTDSIRTVLLHEANVQSTRLVMVTSALGREGKTTLASHLAASLARAHRRTLLIDGDLRRPRLHSILDTPNEPGLSEVLRGHADIADVVRPTHVDQLWLVPAGKCNNHVIQSLAHGTIHQLFARLKQEYDFVVIDTAPVLLVPDTVLIGQHVDTVILAILRNVSQAHRVYAAYQQLATLGIRVLGAVVNGAQDDLYALKCRYTYSQGLDASVRES